MGIYFTWESIKNKNSEISTTQIVQENENSEHFTQQMCIQY